MLNIEGSLKELFKAREAVLEMLSNYQEALERKIIQDTYAFAINIYNELLKEAQGTTTPVVASKEVNITILCSPKFNDKRKRKIVEELNKSLFIAPEEAPILSDNIIKEIYSFLDITNLYYLESSESNNIELIRLIDVINWFRSIGIEPNFDPQSPSSNFSVAVDLPTMKEYTKKYVPGPQDSGK